jgi:hypothetical protein
VVGDGAHFKITMPPHLAQIRVVARSAVGTRLQVAGFPAATSPDGPHTLVTQRETKRSDTPLTEIDLEIHGAAAAP